MYYTLSLFVLVVRSHNTKKQKYQQRTHHGVKGYKISSKQSCSTVKKMIHKWKSCQSSQAWTSYQVCSKVRPCDAQRKTKARLCLCLPQLGF